ncbi:type II toxin-antitoxin system RelE/ParE family toxin [Nocardioides ginsengisoli]|uniref:Type II toxin-antitoxin system RelE/ParE family toxin n=1 Tax=Nocardioides ginsengisoli TaxID=363868 RepID=A0ABW3W3N0_9ACTN
MRDRYVRYDECPGLSLSLRVFYRVGDDQLIVLRVLHRRRDRAELWDGSEARE